MVSMIVNRVLPDLEDEDLLAAFANLGHEGPDPLDDLSGLGAWWSDLGGDPRTTGAEQLDLLRALRDAVRGLALANNGVAGDVDEHAIADLPLTLVLGDRPRLQAVEDGSLTAAVAAEVASALLGARARPSWPRLKACPGPDCAYVFRDRSRSGSRRWCLMSECGNRAKGAAFRARAPRRG